MVQVCSRCHRANPAEAAFCYFDGAPLAHGPGTAAPAAPPIPEFVFGSGRRCRTLEEFAEGCRDEWDEARDLLQRGIIARYLSNARRPDLVRDAEQAQAAEDADVALVELLAALPAPPAGRGPRLVLDPRRIAIAGGLQAGDRKKIRVLIINQGTGLLQGKLTRSDTPWLRFVDAEAAPSIAIHTTDDQQVHLLVDTAGLAGGQNHTAKLTVITNGGIAELPIRVDLGASPFPHAPFQGATTQRQLAEKMRANPRAAVPLLETGEVRKWFLANGWNYPVAGASARGVGAVQQFFECLGLAKCPPVELSEREITLDCRQPGVQAGQVTLRTTARKWVYCEVTSTVPWIHITTPSVSGSQKAVLTFDIDPAELTENRIYEGSVRVRANGGQRLDLTVRANACRPHGASARAPQPTLVVPVQPPVPEPGTPANPAAVPFDFSVPTPSRLQREPDDDPVSPFQDLSAPARTIKPDRPAPKPALASAPQAIPIAIPRPRLSASAQLLSPVLSLAVVFLCARLLLAIPGDLFARWLVPSLLTPAVANANEIPAERSGSRFAEWLGPGDRTLVPGSLQRWLHAPGSRVNPADPTTPLVDEAYLKLFVLATWWLGGVVGLRTVWRNGGRPGDLLAGILAGAGAGLAVSATLGCLLLLGDSLPRILLRLFAGMNLAPVAATVLWLFLVALSYAFWGLLTGFLLLAMGPTGRRIQSFLAGPLASLARSFGGYTTAEFLAPQG
jgi:hypothetical protein